MNNEEEIITNQIVTPLEEGKHETKKARFSDRTICKISTKDTAVMDSIIECLKAAFYCNPTSEVMYNRELKQFYIFLEVSKKCGGS